MHRMTNQVWGWLSVALLGLLGCGSKLEGESLEAWGTEEAGVAALAPKKVMPLGDSITQGAAGRARQRQRPQLHGQRGAAGHRYGEQHQRPAAGHAHQLHGRAARHRWPAGVGHGVGGAQRRVRG